MSRSKLGMSFLVVLIVAMMSSPFGGAVTQAQTVEDEYEVLFFHRTTGFRHGSIPSAIAAVEALGAANGFSVTETQDPEVFTDQGLRPYAAIVLFTDGESTLDHAQRTAFERYVHRGGGVVGLHSSSNMDKADWPWWEDLLGGAFFSNHPVIQTATIDVEDPTHPATAHLPSPWVWPSDEWYNFTANPRDRDVHVLLTVDETTYTGGQMGADHPIAWCSDFDGGRTFYTAIGHSASHYDDADFRQHILGGIEWAAGVAEGDCGDDREGPPTDASFEKVALDDNTANPMRLDITPDGRVIYVELAGRVKIYHPDTQSITTAGQIPVYRDQENGLLGIALDPDFENNDLLYLFYSAPSPNVQHVSRFRLDPASETIDMSSERVLIQIPHQRVECCHSSGDIKFGPDGNLYISTGDDTNPFASSGFGPFDYRAGRDAWDAARTSGNTADLRGKILRITPLEDPGGTPGLGSTYTVPDDNLFTSGRYDHLFPGGTYNPALGLPEIYVMGLRNPFSIAVDQETGWLYYGLVGPDANPAGGSNPDRGPRGYDHWSQVREAGNHGWPYCVVRPEPYRQFVFPSGPSGDFFDCINGPVNESPRNTGLPVLPPVDHLPMIWYPYCNSQGNYTAPVPFPEVPCGPVSGGQNYGTGRAAFMGDVYHFDENLEAEGKFPAYYDNKPFVLEWERDIIASLTLGEDGSYVPDSFEEFMYRTRFDTNQRFRKPHDMKFGPDGNMYLIEWGDDFNFAGGGVNPDSGLYKISFVKGGRTPVARASADPDSGQPPLEVSFSSEGSFDPDEDPITYHWSFADGSTSDEPNPTHTFTGNGVYSVQLTVTDDTERASSSTVTVTVGNTRPEVTIDFPQHGSMFDWGDEIPYRVKVVDAEEGSTARRTIDCADVTVQTGLWHASGGAAHVHPGQSQAGCRGTITTQADAGHGEDAHLATVITASYTDDGGDVDAPLTGGVTHLLQPKRRQAEFFSEVSGAATVPGGDAGGGGDALQGSDGAWASYDPVNLFGIDTVDLRVSALDDTTVELRRGARDGPLVGSADVPATQPVERVAGQDGFGNAVRLNGPSSNQYVELPTGIVSDLTDFTIATWVNRGTTGGQTWARVFDFGTGTSNYMFLTVNSGGFGGNVRFAITTGSGEQQLNSPGQPPANQWQHIAVTLTGTTGRMYRDGVLVATNTNMTLNPSALGNTLQNWIGDSQWVADPFLNATIDEFQIYDRELSEEEIQSLVASPGGTTEGGNVASYSFDEDGGGTVPDSSGRNNHANIILNPNTPRVYTDVSLDLDDPGGTFPLYLVFPQRPARVNYLDFLGTGATLPSCPGTVVVFGVDSGVADQHAGNLDCISDLVNEGDFKNDGQFIRHVRDVTKTLVDQGLLTAPQRGAIIDAASQATGD